MNYEKTILELLSRIQTLEEKVAELMKNENKEKGAGDMTMQEIREYIIACKMDAKKKGQTTSALRSGDIHKELNLKSRMPSVCNAMRQCMELGDKVLHTTPSGNSSTIEIEYKL